MAYMMSPRKKRSSSPTQIQPSLNMVDADTVKKICDIYDWDGKGELALFFLGDIMYAMGYNTTKKICDIYDWDGKGELDLFFLGDVMYALGMNTTKKVCVGLGQTDEEG